jgi:hypothetical protein
LTAVTSVDRTGLLDAAVVTGSADMPEKLPLPLLGTAEQPAPNGLSGMAAELVLAPPAAGAEDEAALSLLLLATAGRAAEQQTAGDHARCEYTGTHVTSPSIT